EVINNSKIVHKYNQEIDRESAYELLNNKIESSILAAEKAKREAEFQKEREKFEKEKAKQTAKTTTRRSTAKDPLVKVLTSATFMRAVFGVLGKIMK
ncbi:MAG: ATPase, partial [Flavobacteriaceae bacterium CG17_big_fil_post_rev_8_21_14_2_50_31_13]